eukprot:Rmarinus@m.28309
MDKLMKNMQALFPPEGMQKLNELFKPQPEDVFVATFAKSGTTWMQQVVHGLRSGGSMDFGEISMVIPFIEIAYVLGQDLNADQGFKPRAFKTHLARDQLPAGEGKIIYVVRDPVDCCFSAFNFFNGWLVEPGEITPDLYAAERFTKVEYPNRYWSHLLSYWEKRDDERMLWIHFEDMKQDLPACVRKVAEFLGITDIDEATYQKILEQSSFQFMKEHDDQFNDHFFRSKRNPACGLPGSKGTSKVQDKKGKAREVLSPETLACIDQRWREIVAPVTGCNSYEELRAKMSILNK